MIEVLLKFWSIEKTEKIVYEVETSLSNTPKHNDEAQSWTLAV